MAKFSQFVLLASAQPKPIGQVEWTTAGTYPWVVPDNVYSISPMVVGAGAAGGVGTGGVGGRAGSGPGLRYATSITVTPGETLTVIVGGGGASRAVGSTTVANPGGDTRIQRAGVDLIWAQGGQATAGGTGSTIGGNIGGGNGGVGFQASNAASNTGGGGAGGYAGDGGAGGGVSAPTAGTGGAGGGGAVSGGATGGRGGGVGIRGQGANGAAGSGDGSVTSGPIVGSSSGSAAGVASQAGSDGGARIIYGEGRFYPSTRTANE